MNNVLTVYTHSESASCWSIKMKVLASEATTHFATLFRSF